MSTPPLRPKFERNIGWMVLALLLVGGVLVMRPFASALLWAVVLCFSIWPLYERLLKVLRGRRTWAALIMALGMILIILLPFVVIGLSLADNVKDLTAAARTYVESGPRAPPPWLEKIPAVGGKASEYWRSLAMDNAKLVEAAKRLLELISGSLLVASLAITRGLFELALSIFIAFFLFRDGVAVAARLTKAVERIGGERGNHLLEVAGKTVRGVVYGILGTALIQALMAGVGFAIAGVPGAALLALLTFFLSVVPMGPPLVWIPAALWLFNQGSTGWGIFMIVWGIAVSSIDNVVKPWLISQGSNMPFLLIFFGVLGGALAFGFIGVFIGPTLLAVGYRLVEGWAAAKREETGEPDPIVVAPS